jgi:predicted metal-dependent peptidase
MIHMKTNNEPTAIESRNALIHINQGAGRVVVRRPFYAVLLMHLNRVEDWTCDTMWTDGINLGYNPRFVLSLTVDEVDAVLCHETKHCAYGHIWRMMWRDPELWNRACDYVINLTLDDEGFRLPKDCLLDQKYRGLTPEQVYELLVRDKQDGKGKGKNKGAGCGMGEFRLPPDGVHLPTLAADWHTTVIEAAKHAKSYNNLPSSAAALVAEIRRPKTDWKAHMMRFIQQCSKSDYSYRKPDKRFVPRLYMPTLISEQLGPIIIAADASGSIDDVIRGKFAGHMQVIMEDCRPEEVIVLWWDTKVCAEERFLPDDELVLHPKGGGGTNINDVFDWVEREQVQPACLIVLTDMDIWDIKEIDEPEYPVMWASILKGKKAPFGELICIADD